ncbi:MAG: class I SAM-dependent methyltransferase [Nanoarchaeota archaeon]|nr:class I SAM-dependent methyltransferase [Nanoarchaeota archaeon]
MKNIRLNLGCGSDIKENCINVDKIKLNGVDIVWDLDKYPYPFEDNSIDRIFAFHILEHVKDYEKTMGELNRIMKKNGALYIRVPHFSSAIANSEFHHRFFCFTNSFTNKRLFKTSTDADFIDYFGFKLKYKKLRFEKGYLFWNYLIEPLVELISPQLYEATILKGLFPARELFVMLIKVKDN